MAPPKRKTSDYVSDGFVENDGDSDRPSKRAKAPASSSRSPYFSSTTVQADSEGNRYWEISKSRRVTISEFKGRQMVSVREYYEQGGKTLPGKKVCRGSGEQPQIQNQPHTQLGLTIEILGYIIADGSIRRARESAAGD